MSAATPEPIPTTASPVRCLVVDDDPLSVQIVLNCIANTPFLTAVGSCSNALDAAEMLRTQAIDALFLDVEMPLMSGIDLLRTLPEPPQVVLITSNQSYAVQAFEFAVTDYLLKPITYPRFLQAAQKVLDAVVAERGLDTEVASQIPQAGPSVEFTFVKVDNKLVRVDFSDVYYIEALGDYVHIVLTHSKFIVYSTMKAIEDKFPQAQFVRVHRSFIVNINHAQALEDNSLLIKEKYIPIGQTYMRGLLQRLNKL
ncbi:MAG: LytR/AlgR family response regulator transcription factor [Janthinobacterium lividum]